jgi:hypothetical protein
MDVANKRKLALGKKSRNAHMGAKKIRGWVNPVLSREQM